MTSLSLSLWIAAGIVMQLAIGLGIGFLAQRSRFRTMGAIRDGLLFGHVHLLSGLVSLIVSV